MTKSLHPRLFSGARLSVPTPAWGEAAATRLYCHPAPTEQPPHPCLLRPPPGARPKLQARRTKDQNSCLTRTPSCMQPNLRCALPRLWSGPPTMRQTDRSDTSRVFALPAAGSHSICAKAPSMSFHCPEEPPGTDLRIGFICAEAGLPLWLESKSRHVHRMIMFALPADSSQVSKNA